MGTELKKWSLEMLPPKVEPLKKVTDQKREKVDETQKLMILDQMEKAMTATTRRKIMMKRKTTMITKMRTIRKMIMTPKKIPKRVVVALKQGQERSQQRSQLC